MRANDSQSTMDRHGDVGAATRTTRTVKRARLEADKRRDVLEKVQDKYADIDYTKYQKMCTGTSVHFAHVRPRPSAVVANWRQLDSYEADGKEIFSEQDFAKFFIDGGGGRHTFACSSEVHTVRVCLAEAVELFRRHQRLFLPCARLAFAVFRGAEVVPRHRWRAVHAPKRFHRQAHGDFPRVRPQRSRFWLRSEALWDTAACGVVRGEGSVFVHRARTCRERWW